MITRFENREEAGRQLGERLALTLAQRRDLVVLGIPRGGVTVAFQVALALRAPLDVFLSHKLGVPGHEELAFGAVTADGGLMLDEQIVRAAGISAQQIEQATAETRALLRHRAALYRGDRPPLDVAGKTVILVDDGIATGASMLVAVRALRASRPGKLIVAVPVTPADTCKWLKNEIDELIFLYAPEDFYAVGQFYRDFAQVSDEQVSRLL